ncbi:hypothetical protein DXG01_000317 [Tephrocybe rancida]|nr:hypothetical protein DXG01_000317 [Tephrocybe rancida]
MHHMTSRNSTFPYNAQDSAKFLKLLRSFRDRVQDGYVRCVVGRLWQLICEIHGSLGLKRVH